MIDVKTYPVAHDKNGGGGGGKTYMIGGQSNVPSNLYVNSINASLGNIKHLTTTTLSSNDANFIYVTANDGNIYKLQGNDLDFYNGHIANLAVDCITADSLDVKNLSALKATIEELIAGNITAKDLTVTGTAHFFELIIDKIRSVGGQLILTPTSCIVDYVQYYKNGTLITDTDQYSTADSYNIYWRGSDPYGRAVNNEWIVNDQAICQSFNNAHVGLNNNLSNKYYWMRVDDKLTDKYINLKTGETTSQQSHTTYNTIYVGMWNTTWTENDNTHDNQIEWNCAVQTIDDVPVSGVNWEDSPSVSGYAVMGTMQTSNKLFGLKITPTGDNKNRMTDKLKFTFEQETSSAIIPATEMNITVTFADDTFMYFPNVQAKQEHGEYVKENGHYVFELDLSEANNPISIITVVCAQDVDWHLCHGIRLNGNVKAENCTGYPEAGDNLIQLGYRGTDDNDRQSAIIISAYKSPDPDVNAPSYAQYMGINDFNLGSHRGSYIDARGAKFVGDITLSSVNGKTMGDTLEDLESTIDQTAGMIRSEVKRSYAHSGDHLDDDNSTSSILDMNWSGVNENYYYKVTISPTNSYTEKHRFIFQVERSRDTDYSYWGKPSYGSQDDPYGFDLMLNMTFITGSTGSWNDGNLYINEYNLQYSNGAVIGTVNTSYGETYVEFYVRGGSKYRIRYSEASQVTTYRDDVLSVVTEPIIYTPTESSIEQTAERISMYVVETEGVSGESLRRTGIDITNGQINLNSDNTNVNGTLNIYNPNCGFQVWDASKTSTVQIRNDKMGQIKDYQFTGSKSFTDIVTGSKPSSSSSSPFTVEFNKVAIGTFSSDVPCKVQNLIFTGISNTNNNTNLIDVGPNRTITKIYWKVQILNSSNDVRLTEEYTFDTLSTITRNFYGYPFNTDLEYTPSTTEALYVKSTMSFWTQGDGNNAGDYEASYTFDTYAQLDGAQRISVDGAIFTSGNSGVNYEYTWWGEYKNPGRVDDDYAFLVRNRRHNFKVTPIGIMRTMMINGDIPGANEGAAWLVNDQLTGDNAGAAKWCDISSCIPVLNASDSTLNLSTDTTNGTPTIAQVGLICNTGSSDMTINLPDPSYWPGKKILFKGIAKGIRFTCDSSTKFVSDDNTDKVNTIPTSGYTAATGCLISNGSYWIHFNSN